jgi:hypothetical protein
VSTVPFQALQGLGLETIIGLHAGINAETSWIIKAVRRWYSSSNKRWQDAWLALPAPAPYKRLSQGMIHVVASYQQGLHPPAGATLITMNPPNAWWGFHRSPEAIVAGEMAMKRFLNLEDSRTPASNIIEDV